VAGELAFFELGVDDVERGRAFYEALFGWRFEEGPSGQGYTISTPTISGGIHGGDQGAAPYVFFEVENMDAALERVRELGGVIDEPGVEGDEQTAERFGRFRLCRDDQGSPFGLYQRPTRRDLPS
jgi:predicted enzyme related to lactoylglutathione lyase